MKFTPATIDGAWIIDMAPHADERGFLARLYCQETFLEHGVDLPTPQANLAKTVGRGTLRGMHYQAAPYGEGKLIHCVAGSVFDVIVDIRPGSPSCGRWFGLELDDRGHRSLYAPPGCAHGYVSLSEQSTMVYLMSAPYVPGAGRGVRWDDPAFGIEWPIEPALISERDRSWPDWAPR